MVRFVLWDAYTGREVSKRYEGIETLRKNVYGYILKHKKDPANRFEVCSAKGKAGDPSTYTYYGIIWEAWGEVWYKPKRTEVAVTVRPDGKLR